MQNECVFRDQKLTEKFHIVSGCPFKCWNNHIIISVSLAQRY